MSEPTAARVRELLALVEDGKLASAAEQRELGCYFLFGDGVERDNLAAVQWLTPAANAGDAEAQFRLGICFFRGEGVGKDMARGVRLFRTAADQGHAQAQFQVGRCCERGDGVAKNAREGVRYYRMAVDQGLDRAQHNLGVCFLYGEGVAKDERQAVRYFRMASEQGLTDSQQTLAHCLKYGTGVAKDVREAERYLQMAADQGDTNSQFKLAELSIQNNADLRKATSYFHKAALQGHALAQYNLGVCYMSGKGVMQDQHSALTWLLKAAKQGIPEAPCLCRIHEMLLRRTCAHCRVIQSGLKRCGGCKVAAYCSPDHQLAHWKEHKPVCRLMSEALSNVAEVAGIAPATPGALVLVAPGGSS
jgi:TPR repeat protein